MGAGQRLGWANLGAISGGLYRSTGDVGFDYDAGRIFHWYDRGQ